MFWGRVKCPVNDKEKAWIEESFLQLVAQFGSQILCETKVVLPLPEYFPDPYNGTEECARRVVDRVCEYMSVPPEQIVLDFYFGEREIVSAKPSFWGGGGSYTTRGTTGLYINSEDRGKAVIAIESSLLEDSPALVATVAHELGHSLLKDRRLSGSRGNLEYECLVDLVPIFYGLGVLTAEVAFRSSRWQPGAFQDGWRLSRHGYLSEPMYGYALASFAWMRGERKPGWARYLSLNIGTFLKQSLRYLHKTGDTSLPLYRQGG